MISDVHASVKPRGLSAAAEAVSQGNSGPSGEPRKSEASAAAPAPRIQVQSYGGGVQSVALAILNATGKLENPAKLAIFADPGMEEAGTYEHLEIMRPWLAKRGIELVIVRGQYGKLDGPNLYDYIVTKPTATVLPVRGDRGLYPRQCTKNWKVDGVQRELRRRGAKAAVVQLGISFDEIHRAHDSRTKWVEHRFPLCIDQRITRSDCRDIIRAEGIPVPPKSGCQFCPFQSQARWRWRAASEPDSFEKAARLEDVLRDRMIARGHGPVFLSSALRPLREAFPPGQLVMFENDVGDADGLCGGYCFT